MHFHFNSVGDLGTSYCKDKVEKPVANHPAHDRFGHIPDGTIHIPHLKEKILWIPDLVLHGPLKIDHVEVTTQHE